MDGWGRKNKSFRNYSRLNHPVVVLSEIQLSLCECHPLTVGLFPSVSTFTIFRIYVKNSNYWFGVQCLPNVKVDTIRSQHPEKLKRDWRNLKLCFYFWSIGHGFMAV